MPDSLLARYCFACIRPRPHKPSSMSRLVADDVATNQYNSVDVVVPSRAASSNEASVACSFPFEVVEAILNYMSLSEIAIAAAHLPKFWRLVIQSAKSVRLRLMLDSAFDWNNDLKGRSEAVPNRQDWARVWMSYHHNSNATINSAQIYYKALVTQRNTGIIQPERPILRLGKTYDSLWYGEKAKPHCHHAADDLAYAFKCPLEHGMLFVVRTTNGTEGFLFAPKTGRLQVLDPEQKVAMCTARKRSAHGRIDLFDMERRLVCSMTVNPAKKNIMWWFLATFYGE